MTEWPGHWHGGNAPLGQAHQQLEMVERRWAVEPSLDWKWQTKWKSTVHIGRQEDVHPSEELSEEVRNEQFI